MVLNHLLFPSNTVIGKDLGNFRINYQKNKALPLEAL